VPLSRNLGTLTSWNPLGLSRPVMGLLYLSLYMFRTVFPSIIRSSTLYIQQQAFVRQILLSAGRKTKRPSETCRVSFQNKIIRYIGASSWFYYRNSFFLIMSLETITVSYESLTKHINTLFRKNAGLLKCTADGTLKFITTVL